jgi:hypothetical protein
MASDRQALKPPIALRKDGRTALWICTPGSVAEKLSLDAMTDFTGFTFETGLPWGPIMHATKFDHPITSDVPLELFRGTNNVLGPLFHVKDAQTEILGQVVSAGGRCKLRLAVHTLSGGKRELRLPSKAEIVYDQHNDTDMARETDRFTVDIAPISNALWYARSARTVESLRRKGKR